jgi:membrane protease YdiL (CAAX protease family)
LAYRAFIPFLLWIFGDGFLAPNGDTAPWAVAVPTNFGTYLVVALSTIMSAFEEELLMRGYLLPRFEQLLKSTWAGLFLTAILFGSYHAYQGMGAVLVTALIGLVYGFAFCLTRRLLPIVAAHGLHNLFSILA